MVHLQFHNGPLGGQRIILTDEQISVGSGPNNMLQIEHVSVANKHLLLIRKNEAYQLFLHLSKPTTKVNGQAVESIILKNGDRLEIGEIRATYRVSDEPIPAKEPIRKLGYAPLILGGFAVVVLGLVVGLAVVYFSKKSTSTETTNEEVEQPDLIPPRVKTNDITKKDVAAVYPIGVGASGLRPNFKVHRSRNFDSYQAAVDAAQPGDAVIFDSVDDKPIVVQRPLNDIQFIGGLTKWDLKADLIDCQFFFQEFAELIQDQGKVERCAFFQCKHNRTFLNHADTVTFYQDQSTAFIPKEKVLKHPMLELRGYVRNVMIFKPFLGALHLRNWDMNWEPLLRIHATDPIGNGTGSYILSPVIRGQTAWTPCQIGQGNGITFAHSSTAGNQWADPVLQILQGSDCVVLCTSFGGQYEIQPLHFSMLPRPLEYHDHTELGRGIAGPPYRGAVMIIAGQGNRIASHGDSSKPWSLGRRMTLPGLHYADGIVACDPFIQQFSTETGGVSVNLAENKQTFLMTLQKNKVDFTGTEDPQTKSPRFPKEGANLHRPVFVPLKDLRLDPGQFSKYVLVDLTGKPSSEIESQLEKGRAVFLGAGTYEMTKPIQNGLIVGAGMEQTILKWPASSDCLQRGCQGAVNCTIQGGKIGHNMQTGRGQRLETHVGLFLRTRFSGQKEAGVHLVQMPHLNWQDCEFTNMNVAFTHSNGLLGNKGKTKETGNPLVEHINLCNCSFRNITEQAIRIQPNSPQGQIAIHNCKFVDVKKQAVQIGPGKTYLIQQCEFSNCGEKSTPVIQFRSTGVAALSHLQMTRKDFASQTAIDCQGQLTMSHLTIQGYAKAIQCRSIACIDHVESDGDLETNKDSLIFQSTFRNLPKSIVSVRTEKEFQDISQQAVGIILDTTPPPEVSNLRVRTVNKVRQLEWEPVNDPESGIVQYVIYAEAEEIARTPLAYEPAGENHSPFVQSILPSTYVDPKREHSNYSVKAINGAGLISGGGLAPIRSWGMARGKFLSKEGKEITIKEIVPNKGKDFAIIDIENQRYPLTTLGRKGLPNQIFFPPGKLIHFPSNPKSDENH